MKTFKHPKAMIIVAGVLLMVYGFQLLLISFALANTAVGYFPWDSFVDLFIGLSIFLIGLKIEKIKYAYQFLISLIILWFSAKMYMLYDPMSPYSYWDTIDLYYLEAFIIYLLIAIFFVIYFIICHFKFKKSKQQKEEIFNSSLKKD